MPYQIQTEEDTEMETIKFIYYQNDDMWIGWLEDFPDYRTQGHTLDELKEHLKDIYNDLCTDAIPCVHRVGKLAVA
jgi:predicted RNase H-like HicB family nuclease